MSDNSSCISRLPAVLVREPDPNSAYSDYWTILLPICEDWDLERIISSEHIPEELQKCGQPIWLYHDNHIEARQNEDDIQEQVSDGFRGYGT